MVAGDAGNAGHEECAGGGVEHGGGEAQLCLVETTVTRDEFLLCPSHDPAWAGFAPAGSGASSVPEGMAKVG